MKKGRRAERNGGAPHTVVVEQVARYQIEQLPRRVARRAADLGITYAEIAQRMGVSRPVVSRETNRDRVTIYFFQRLCAALELAETDPHWTDPLPPIMTAKDGAQKFIAKARQARKDWLKNSD